MEVNMPDIKDKDFVNWINQIITITKNSILYYGPSDEIQIRLMEQIRDKYLSIKLETPVEQIVDAGQSEKIIGDAFHEEAVKGLYEGQTEHEAKVFSFRQKIKSLLGTLEGNTVTVTSIINMIDKHFEIKANRKGEI